MSVHNIRFGSILSFDEEQEKDIIKSMEALNASHKTGQFMSNLIRVAFDNPELLDVKDGKMEKGIVIKQMEALGMSNNRNMFMQQLKKDVADMKKKVDDIYNMTMNIYILAQMGKHLGLESKSENLLSANFLLEKQIKDLQDSLGTTLTSSVFASNNKETAKQRADLALEYIIETYSGIVNELKTMVQPQVIQQVVQAQPVEVQPQPVAQSVTQSVAQPVTQPVTQVQTPQPQAVINGDTEIDFGTDDDMDIEALTAFFSNT